VPGSVSGEEDWGDQNQHAAPQNDQNEPHTTPRGERGLRLTRLDRRGRLSGEGGAQTEIPEKMRTSTGVRAGPALLICLVALCFFSIPAAARKRFQLLHKHVRPAVTNGQAARVGPMSTSQRMRLAIILPLRNQSELTNLLRRLYDPSSPDYRHFLSVAQFTQQFGPTKQDYQAVVKLARSNGFRVTNAPANRLLVHIDGTVAQINKAFHVAMTTYRHPTENRNFYSPDREPSLDLSVPVAHIAGLNNFSLPRPKFKRARRTFAAAALARGQVVRILVATCVQPTTAAPLSQAAARRSGCWSSTATT
jgi:hypothetical protein